MHNTIEKDLLEKNYLNKNKKFTHITGKKIKLFPFLTNTKDKDDLLHDLKAFNGIVGESIRQYCNYGPIETNKEEIIKRVISQVETTSPRDLSDVIEKLFFDSDDNIYIYNKKMFAYQNVKVKKTILEDISTFIKDVFLNDIKIEPNFFNTDEKSNNVMYTLINSSLPNFSEPKLRKKNIEFSSNLQNIKNLFVKDLTYISQDDTLFINNFNELIKYYFFYYISQLNMHLNNFFNINNKTDIYFSLDWEPLSLSRSAYKFGWKLLEKKSENIFSHANCLELLNYIKIDGVDSFIYSDLNRVFEAFTEEEYNSFSDKIKYLTEFYTKNINDVNWEKFSFEKNQDLNGDNELLKNQIKNLWKKIDFQFQETSRLGAYKKYANWFKEFCKQNYLKNRGRLGATLAINQDFLLMMTHLCIGNNEEQKIRLTSLWDEFSLRGLNFDQFSKKAIVDFFEKINLLEKKSDSGDAQYVKILGK